MDTFRTSEDKKGDPQRGQMKESLNRKSAVFKLTNVRNPGMPKVVSTFRIIYQG